MPKEEGKDRLNIPEYFTLSSTAVQIEVVRASHWLCFELNSEHMLYKTWAAWGSEELRLAPHKSKSWIPPGHSETSSTDHMLICHRNFLSKTDLLNSFKILTSTSNLSQKSIEMFFWTWEIKRHYADLDNLFTCLKERLQMWLRNVLPMLPIQNLDKWDFSSVCVPRTSCWRAAVVPCCVQFTLSSSRPFLPVLLYPGLRYWIHLSTEEWWPWTTTPNLFLNNQTGKQHFWGLYLPASLQPLFSSDCFLHLCHIFWDTPKTWRGESIGPFGSMHISYWFILKG